MADDNGKVSAALTKQQIEGILQDLAEAKKDQRELAKEVQEQAKSLVAIKERLTLIVIGFAALQLIGNSIAVGVATYLRGP